MPKLYSLAHIVSILLQNGFSFVSQKDSHAKYRKGACVNAIIPVGRKEIPFGTFRSVLRQSGLTEADFK